MNLAIVLVLIALFIIGLGFYFKDKIMTLVGMKKTKKTKLTASDAGDAGNAGDAGDTLEEETPDAVSAVNITGSKATSKDIGGVTYNILTAEKVKSIGSKTYTVSSIVNATANTFKVTFADVSNDSPFPTTAQVILAGTNTVPSLNGTWAGSWSNKSVVVTVPSVPTLTTPGTAGTLKVTNIFAEDLVASGTPASGTPASGTPAAGTPAPVTPAPVTPAPVTPAPVTPATPAAPIAAIAANTSIQCSANDLNPKDVTHEQTKNFYRAIGDSKLSWYPTAAIASSWDPNYASATAIDCTGASLAVNMTVNPAAQPDWKCYVKRYKDLMKAFADDQAAAATHYTNHGQKEGRNPFLAADVTVDGVCPAVDVNCYLKRHKDLRVAFGTDVNRARDHLKRHGVDEGRNVFPGADTGTGATCVPDWDCYMYRHRDLLAAFKGNHGQAANHFNVHGKNESRNPYPDADVLVNGVCPKFSANCYLARYGDLRNAFGGDEGRAADHYSRHGAGENRNPFCNTCAEVPKYTPCA